MADEERKAGMDETLFRLLQTEAGKSMDQGSLLVLLSLVNLMGILDMIGSRFAAKENRQAEGSIDKNRGPSPGGAGLEMPGAGGRDLLALVSQLLPGAFPGGRQPGDGGTPDESSPDGEDKK